MDARTPIAKVTDEEKDEIEMLFERLLSLQSLSLTLAANNDLYREKSYLTEKIVTDLSKTQNEYNLWWNKTIKQYNLKNDARNLQIDFNEGNIYCTS